MPNIRLTRRREAWLRIAAGAAAAVLVVVSAVLGVTLYDGFLLVLFAGVLAQVAALPVALFRPWVAALLSVVGAVAIMASAHGGTVPWPWAVTTMITQAIVLALLGYRAKWPLGVGTLVGVVVISGVVGLVVEPARSQEAVAVNLVVFASIGGIALAAGVLARQWEGVRRQLARERQLTEEERAARLAVEERTRIARELHDVVAHSMSIISIQATSAPVRLPQVDAATGAEFAEIAALSRKALVEMRSLLGVLRIADAPAARAPQPRLTGIAELVAQSQRSGLEVRLLGAEALRDDGVDEAVGLSAYRIVQEALSNAMRHAKGAAVEVRVHRDGELDLRVTNRPSPYPVATVRRDAEPTSGTGLVGMRERAVSVGGTLTHGTTTDGGYEIHAVLPLEPPDTGLERT
jgi:signal transduction histidine kinase